MKKNKKNNVANKKNNDDDSWGLIRINIVVLGVLFLVFAGLGLFAGLDIGSNNSEAPSNDVNAAIHEYSEALYLCKTTENNCMNDLISIAKVYNTCLLEKTLLEGVTQEK